MLGSLLDAPSVAKPEHADNIRAFIKTARVVAIN
jgi:hypothetical protein